MATKFTKRYTLLNLRPLGRLPLSRYLPLVMLVMPTMLPRISVANILTILHLIISSRTISPNSEVHQDHHSRKRIIMVVCQMSNSRMLIHIINRSLPNMLGNFPPHQSRVALLPGINKILKNLNLTRLFAILMKMKVQGLSSRAAARDTPSILTTRCNLNLKLQTCLLLVKETAKCPTHSGLLIPYLLLRRCLRSLPLGLIRLVCQQQ
mmetsp:Transcript_239/g.431  ORF Transcript_239/g.431 Transcript_239/m.431 type:complete len:208 (+) Transcript_239:45-668(+)